jgi:hypothetical protein
MTHTRDIFPMCFKCLKARRGSKTLYCLAYGVSASLAGAVGKSVWKFCAKYKYKSQPKERTK